MIANSEALRKKEEEGRALLQMKPIDRTVYGAWSDATREIIRESLGKGSGLLKEFIAARRTISVSFDTDPSYFLTQLAANIRRELAVLKKCIEETGAGEPVAPPPPRPAHSSAPVRAESPAPAPRGPTPAPEAVAARHLPKAARLLVISGFAPKTDKTVVSALERWSPVQVDLPTDLAGIRELVGRGGEAACAVVIVSGGEDKAFAPEERPAGQVAIQKGFALGLLVGLLGAERVCFLHEEGVTPPLQASGVLHVCLQDPDGWRPKVLQRFRDAGVPLKERSA